MTVESTLGCCSMLMFPLNSQLGGQFQWNMIQFLVVVVVILLMWWIWPCKSRSWISACEDGCYIMLKFSLDLCGCAIEDKGPYLIVKSYKWKGYCIKYNIKGWGTKVYAPWYTNYKGLVLSITWWDCVGQLQCQIMSAK